jgi:enamine deaminase RidA (YjgF/YER057c/UK114 family)
MATVSERLADLGLELPAVAQPIASYVPAVQAGEQVFISGQLPMKEGELLARGPVSSAVSVEQAQEAAQRCVLNGLAALGQILDEDWSQLVRLAKVSVYVYSDPDFDRQHQVANGASDLVGRVLGDAGVHARSAVGASALPLGASVEVEMAAVVGR